MTQPGSIIEVEDNDHSEWGPSAAHRWMNCPASVQATRNVPDIQTEYAASGTASHTLSQWCRERGVRCDKFLGTILRVGAFDNLVDKARVTSVNTFCDYMADLGGHQFCEIRVDYKEYVPFGFGTSDGIAVVADTVHGVDYKDGSGVVVEAEDNEQLLLYVLGWLLKYHWLYPDVKFVKLHIVQPRVNHFVQSRVYTVEEVFTWADTVVRERYAQTMLPDAPFKAGPWCSQNFCRIRFTCRHRAKDLLDAVVASDFDDLDAATTLPTRQLATLSHAEVDKILFRVTEVAKWAGEIRAWAASQIQQGVKIGEWKFVRGRSERTLTVAEPDAVREILTYTSDNDLPIAEKELYTEPELLSVAQLEKVLGKKVFAEETDKKPAGPLAHLVRKKPGRPTLAPGTDKRPAITAEAFGDFENLDEEM